MSESAIGRFTINSDGDAISFASGNLQYQASDGVWRFAEHQYDRIGNAAGNTTASGRNTQSDWIDLFGYGCNGVDKGQAEYQPWATDTDWNNYFNGNICGTESDFSHVVGNGWRSIVGAEFNYILYSRGGGEDSYPRFAKCTVYGVKCLAIFPDDYDRAVLFDPSSINNSNAPFNSTELTYDGYTLATEHGVVFLPTTGYRNGTEVSNTECGYYRTCFHSNIGNASILFNSENVSYENGHVESLGYATRLVKDKAPPLPDPDPYGHPIGVFSINPDGDSVSFASGNLRYRASDGAWWFAEHQYDALLDGGGNSTAIDDGRATQEEWIDLFNRGTNGIDNGQEAYEPWSVEQNNSLYFHGDMCAEDSEMHRVADFGYAYSMANGGETEWWTLSRQEFDYILNWRGDRTTDRYAKGVVNGVNCLIIIPDNYGGTYTFTNTNTPTARFTSNIIDSATYDLLTDYGVVFMPLTGSRDGTYVKEATQNGLYFCCDNVSETSYYLFLISSSVVSLQGNPTYGHGRSVRLVTDSDTPQPPSGLCSIIIKNVNGVVLDPSVVQDRQHIFLHIEFNHTLYDFDHWEDGHGNTLDIPRAPSYTYEHQVFETNASCGTTYTCRLRLKEGGEGIIVNPVCTMTITDANNNILNINALRRGQTVYLHLDFDHDSYEFDHWEDGNGNILNLQKAEGYTDLNPIYKAVIMPDSTFKCVIKDKVIGTCSITLSVVLDGDEEEGIASVTITPEEYSCGDTVTLSTEPNTCCHKFIRWSDGVTTPTRTYNTVSGQDIALSAIYEKAVYVINSYNVDTSNPNSGYVDIISGGTVECGSPIVLEAVAGEYYHFTDWYDPASDTSLSTDNPFSTEYTCDTPKTIVAYFEENPYSLLSYASDIEGCETAIPAHAPSSVEDVKFYVGESYTVLGLEALSEEEGYSADCFSKRGFMISGWTTEVGGSSVDYNFGDAIDFTAEFVEDNPTITLYPVWVELPTYTITYDLQGGTAPSVPPTASYLAGETVNIWNALGISKEDSGAIHFTPTGFFEPHEDVSTGAWDGTVIPFGDTTYVMPENDIVMVVQWNETEMMPIVVRYTCGSGSGEDIIMAPFYYPQTITLNDNSDDHFTKEHYYLSSWICENNELSYPLGGTYGPVSRNTTFRAAWTIRPNATFRYSIEHEVCDGIGDVSGTFNGDTAYNGEPFTFANRDSASISDFLQRNHLRLLGWTTNPDSSEVEYGAGETINAIDLSDFTIDAQNNTITVYGIVECEQRLTVSYYSDENHSYNLDALTQSYYDGDDVPIQQMPDACISVMNKTFSYWCTTADGTGEWFKNANNTTPYGCPDTLRLNGESVRLYAVWDVPLCNIGFVVNDTARVSTFSINGVSVPDGVSFMYEALPDAPTGIEVPSVSADVVGVTYNSYPSSGEYVKVCTES